jgi:putative transposase
MNIQGLMQGISNDRNMADASWGRFNRMVEYKAETACKLHIKVPSQNTSQDCCGCGATVPKTLAVRMHKCPHCGLKIDRDFNASLNIKHLGLERVGWEPSEYTPVEIRTSTQLGKFSSLKQELLYPQGEKPTPFRGG